MSQQIQNPIQAVDQLRAAAKAATDRIAELTMVRPEVETERRVDYLQRLMASYAVVTNLNNAVDAVLAAAGFASDGSQPAPGAVNLTLAEPGHTCHYRGGMSGRITSIRRTGVVPVLATSCGPYAWYGEHDVTGRLVETIDRPGDIVGISFDGKPICGVCPAVPATPPATS